VKIAVTVFMTDLYDITFSFLLNQSPVKKNNTVSLCQSKKPEIISMFGK